MRFSWDSDERGLYFKHLDEKKYLFGKLLDYDLGDFENLKGVLSEHVESPDLGIALPQEAVKKFERIFSELEQQPSHRPSENRIYGPTIPQNDPDFYEGIEPGVRSLVRAFHRRGYTTLASCEGHADLNLTKHISFAFF
jgi:hypothetical protein